MLSFFRLKPNIKNNLKGKGIQFFHFFSFVSSPSGFTLVEFLVVISIMGIMASLVVANFALQRVPRDLRIAQNEMITNLRKLQSYALSSRTLDGGQAVQFYILKLPVSGASQSEYQIQAMYDTSLSPKLSQNVETFRLPPLIKIQSLKIVRNVVPTVETPSCALIAYRLPFASMTLTSGCTFNNFSGSSPLDHYSNIMDFRTNVDNNPTSKDSKLVITLSDADNTRIRKVLVNSISGNICPTVDENTCSEN